MLSVLVIWPWGNMPQKLLKKPKKTPTKILKKYQWKSWKYTNGMIQHIQIIYERDYGVIEIKLDTDKIKEAAIK